MAIIRNPIEWSFDQLRALATHTGLIWQTPGDNDNAAIAALPKINHIEVSDLRDALRLGLADFAAARSDVLALSLVYPAAGLILWWLAANYDMLPLVFPLISGFALLGPIAAVGLYEISRQREAGRAINWASALEVVKSPSFGAILVLGFALLGIFLIWLVAAQFIFASFLGPIPPNSATAMFDQVITTAAGRTMALVGIAVGFVFAVVVFAISAVSFPMLLDRHVGLGTAVVTSVRAVLENPLMMTVWGLIVVGALVVGSLPLLVGLIVVLPVLGHTTWHLYRKLVAK
jgi:uncharacterized membrane protein